MKLVHIRDDHPFPMLADVVAPQSGLVALMNSRFQIFFQSVPEHEEKQYPFFSAIKISARYRHVPK
jgi:hypothetical protein